MVKEFVEAMLKTLNRSMSYMVPFKKWDGYIELNELFESEKLPERGSGYFDQRYIDYLSKQVHEIDKINWRQFEGLTAEYFKRNGFEVKLGAGRNDNGVDIKAIKEGQVIIIQCKRYKSSNKVKIEYVKALYFDIEEHNAERALLATTSYLEPNGKKICEARKYNIDCAEYNNIVEWVNSMKRGEYIDGGLNTKTSI